MSCIRYVIGVDPSGSFNEGKGTTGIAIYDIVDDAIIDIKVVCAADYDSLEAYLWGNWRAIGMLYVCYCDEGCVVSIEDFLVYATHAVSFTNSRMETCQLLGFLKAMMYNMDIKYYMRPASTVKSRWANHILAHNGYIKQVGTSCFHQAVDGPLATHMLDAIRHAVHCGLFEVNKE